MKREESSKSRKRASVAAKRGKPSEETVSTAKRVVKRRVVKEEATVERSVETGGVVQSEGKRGMDMLTANRLKQLLELREKIRRNRPRFVRNESWRYVKIKEQWRRPRGKDNKMRTIVKGWPRRVKIGYRGPAEARGLHPSGFRDVRVNTVKELEGLNPEIDAVRFASSLGGRKKSELLRRANELGLKVLNPRGVRVVRAEE